MTTENDPIREFQARMNRVSEKAESLRPTIRAVQDAIDRAAASASVSVKLSGPETPTVSIMTMVKQSLKDEVMPLLRELAKEGIRTRKNEDPTDQSLFGVIGVRTYKMESNCELMVCLIGANDEAEAKGCRMVQTGTMEVPKYEVVCDE